MMIERTTERAATELVILKCDCSTEWSLRSDMVLLRHTYIHTYMTYIPVANLGQQEK